MAEMTAKQAIAVLHNNQYQKHLGKGEYDYIHPLTDAECKGIESLIQQQQQQIEQQAAEIEEKLIPYKISLAKELAIMTERAEQSEAQCAAMQTAINRYVFGNIELLDALKAALEEKP